MHGQKGNIAELLMFKVVDHWLTSYKENQTTELTFYDVASQSITMLKVKIKPISSKAKYTDAAQDSLILWKSN